MVHRLHYHLDLINELPLFRWSKFVLFYQLRNPIDKRELRLISGVSHGSEVYLFFYRNYSDAVLTEQDVIFSDELIKRWVNFVDTGYAGAIFNYKIKIYS